MKIASRLGLQVSIFVFVATGVLLLLVNFQLKKFAVTIATEKARFFLEEKQATIDYVVEHLRPPLFKLIKEKGMPDTYFDPRWMSAGYINRNIMKYLSKTEFADFYYKNAAINARSPENEADLIEAAFLEDAQKTPEILRRSAVVDFDGKPFFIFMRTNTSRFHEFCLKCHSTPEKAPPDLIRLYGRERSFGKKIGDVVSVLSVRIPLESIYASINTLTSELFIIICGFSGFFFFVQLLIAKKIVVSPLIQIKNQAIAITADDSRLGERVVGLGKGELKELADAFSNMSKRLAENRDHLNEMVKERTLELENSRKEYQDLFEMMLDGFALHEMIFDDDGKPADYVFLKVNPAFEKITGLNADSILGKSVLAVMPGTEQYWLETYGNVVKKDMPLQFEHYFEELEMFFWVSAFKADDNQFACVFRDITERKRSEADREQMISELKEALSQIKKLSGLLPICSHCKKIRDDKGYWKQIESYIEEHSEAEFSHSICQECARTHYPDIDLYDEFSKD